MVQTLHECLGVWVWAFGSVLCPRPKITDRQMPIFNKKQFAEFKHGSRPTRQDDMTTHLTLLQLDL